MSCANGLSSVNCRVPRLACPTVGRLAVAAILLPTLGCATTSSLSGKGTSAEATQSSQVEPAADVVHLDTPSHQPESPVDKAVLTVAKLPDKLAKAAEPSNDRDWKPDMARLPSAEFRGNLVTVHDIRNGDYRTAEDYTLDYYDKTFDLDKLRTVDFVVVPFLSSSNLAHLMMSFGFEGQGYVCLSIEIRPEKGEKYVPLDGMLRQYELMYVIADERDLVKQCADVYRDVLIYRARFTPEEARALFVDVLDRANQLAAQPEFYNTLTNNCTTNLVRHINRLGTWTVPYNYMVVFPGHFDRLLYTLGLIDRDVPFTEARRRARVNQLAYLHAQSPDFSEKIRR